MHSRIHFIGCAILWIAGAGSSQDFHPDIPKAWDDKEVASFEVPLAQRDRSPRYMTAVQAQVKTHLSFLPGVRQRSRAGGLHRIVEAKRAGDRFRGRQAPHEGGVDCGWKNSSSNRMSFQPGARCTTIARPFSLCRVTPPSSFPPLLCAHEGDRGGRPPLLRRVSHPRHVPWRCF